MLFDTRQTDGNESFKPQVDNSIKPAKATGGQKFGFILLCIITLGIFYLAAGIPKRNHLLRRMNDIQEAASTIQASQKKRRDILLKLMDSVKGYSKFEKETLEQITKYRSKIEEISNETDKVKVESIISEATRAINIQFERYPDLKASAHYMQLSSEIVIQEEEIYSAIRNYNYRARTFNQEIYTFYTVVIAEKLGLYNQPLFKASEAETQDVDTSSLWK
ncbi:LemA family [Metamycoplasma cloacale]|uniref:LemA family protein n=1 Tax=Metamycoplasma cloacale TaxID=92401 RepID=A0A2Z4LM89_9BACT|nr:LemA family protein [Metamycoplasma cloacale]AWX42892.1 LemA family protein [Metamycoplasma cloacale]VEU79284.1 LemA family [Metamycoplasma cloacale]